MDAVVLGPATMLGPSVHRRLGVPPGHMPIYALASGTLSSGCEMFVALLCAAQAVPALEAEGVAVHLVLQ